jgi:hypothetical protein
MVKFKDIDLIQALRDIIEANTVYYKTDLNYDIDFIRNMARNGDETEKSLLFYTRPSGTFCDTARQVFQQDTSSHNSWRFYNEQTTNERILANALEVKGVDMKTGAVTGDLYELDYRKHAEHVRKSAVPASAVTFYDATGKQERMSVDDYKNAKGYELPKHNRMRHEPENPKALLALLQQEKEANEQNCESKHNHDFQYHVGDLHDGRVTFEAARITKALDRIVQPNSPDKNRFMIAIEHHIVQFASNEQLDKLTNALLFKDVSLSTIKGRRGMYAVVGKDEILRARKPKVKPPITERLKEKAAQISVKNDAPIKKRNDLEV